MNKWLKILIGFTVTLIILVVALVALVNVLITPENVKGTILPLAENHLQRKINFGDIDVGLFSGIEIHGLEIYEKNNQDVFVSTSLVRLKYQFLPLLAMKVVVDEVRLERPSIRVIRLKGGDFNFSDLRGGADANSNEGISSSTVAVESKENTSSISLLVSDLLLQDGKLIYIDHVLNNSAPYRYEITGLQVGAKGVSFSGEVPLSMECQINGSPLMLDGSVNLLPFSGNFDVELKDLDVVAFNPYFKNALPGKLGGMKLSFKTNLSGTFDEVALKGNVRLTELDLLLDALPEAPLVNTALSIDYDLLFGTNQRLLQVRQFDLDYNGIKAGAKGKVASLLDQPTLDLTIAIPDLQVRQAIDAVPQSLLNDVSNLDPAGSLSAEVVLSGGLGDSYALLKSASVDLDGVQATVGGQRPAFSGQLLLEGAQVRSEALQIRLGDNNAEIKLDAEHIFETPIKINANITSERFLIEPLLREDIEPVALADESKVVALDRDDSKDELGPFDIPVHAKGTINITEASLKSLTIENFIAQYELKDNIINLSRMEGQIAGGSFRNSARVDLGKKGFSYTAELRLQSIQADHLLTAFVPQAAGTILGSMDMTLDINGRGTHWDALRRKLSGNGNMMVVDGHLISPELIKALSSFLQLSDLDDIKFDRFDAEVKIVDGKVKIESQMLSDKIKLFPEGFVGLDGSLNLSLDTRLNPELSAKLYKRGEVASYLADQDGWTQMPLLLNGTFSSPRFGLDPKGAKKQATKALSNELGRQMDKLFKNNTKSPGDDSAPVEEPAQKLLQDSLQKLFGD